MNSGGTFGALNPDSKAAEEHAEQYYESVRHMKTDVDNISKNTGWKYEAISRIKDYVFFEEHELFGGLSRFTPSYEMAQSWQRLAQGNAIEEQDLVLLKHEYLELTLVKKGYSQNDAHVIASKSHNYADYLGGKKNG